MAFYSIPDRREWVSEAMRLSLPRLRRELRNRKMTKKVISTIRHYKRNADGSLRFVGIEKREVEETHVTHIAGLDERDEADAIRRARELEDFEALADAACACGE